MDLIEFLVTLNPKTYSYFESKSNIEVLIKTLDQLKLLWSHKFISILFDVKAPISGADIVSSMAAVGVTNKTNFKMTIKGVFDKLVNSKQPNLLNSTEAQSVYRICSFYRQLLLILNEPRIEILSGKPKFL